MMTFLEAKEVVNLEGVRCLESPTNPLAVRVIDGARQLGRLKHDILAVGPTLLIPGAPDRAEHWLDWWISSWEPSYREVRLSNLRSARDLGDIAFDSGVQLGAGKLVSVRRPALTTVMVPRDTVAEGNVDHHRGTAARGGGNWQGDEFPVLQARLCRRADNREDLCGLRPET